MTEDYEYHRNKRPDKTYVSKSLSFGQQSDRRFRIASKVFDSPETHNFALEHGEHVIRVTPGRRQEIVAKFYEDNRKIFVLTIQRFTPATGVPHQLNFSFVGDEIPKLIEFLSNLRLIYFPNDNGLNITDDALKKLLLSPQQVRLLIAQNQELIFELASSAITKSDLISLGYRKKQLEIFEQLLFDADYFEEQKRSTGATDEGVWQNFFEGNKWIFGYGLTYIFLAGLDDRKLEQVVIGHTFADRGKRADAVMKTKGAIEALCFVEIKKNSTPLLKTTPYRPGCWSPSDELSGGVSQLQGTLEQAVRKLSDKLEIQNDDGDPTGEQLFSYHPRSFLVIGSLTQFEVPDGINKDKYRSFELFRRNTIRPEILTFDELYLRAKFIFENPN